ncbi:Transcriptional regulator, MarR family [Oleispira antarctica RB-8]|uniref:Transcriptional regulator, MarR family n=1 Tax=Oleispira antarctica RB-8 TaxID=698738 RepID=R4YPR7_OLEAN|nr:Transcriptional regulator, MarR family [Oleispira antarctica RB-8]|tara:strand:+ start:151 stop:573 length:423 start_codon:yes stop_codon:yes gene_type:complete
MKALDKRLFFLLNMAQRKLFNHVDKVCEDALDTSVTQLAALLYIVKHAGCLQKEVAKALSLNKSAVTGLIVRMEKKALLERFVSDEDARAIKLYPTPTGVQKTLELMPFIDELNSTFDEEFSDEEMQTVLKFLNFIIKKF